MFLDDETTLCDEKQRSRLKTPSKASPTAEKKGDNGGEGNRGSDDGGGGPEMETLPKV